MDNIEFMILFYIYDFMFVLEMEWSGDDEEMNNIKHEPPCPLFSW